MRFKDSTKATVTRWTEYRAPSGRWSKVKHELEESEYTAGVLTRFFSWKMPRERRQYAYFREGYLPYRVTVPFPDGTMRHVHSFRYWTED